MAIFTGTAGNDTLSGALEADTISGLAGNDSLSGGAAADTLDGGTGNDTLVGGLGNDVMQGGAQDDVYVVAVGDLLIENANEGIDTVRSSISWTLGDNFENLEQLGGVNVDATGNTQNNSLRGNSGNNMLSGAAGDDDIDGGSGNDTLNGGVGDDVLRGGSGADVAVFSGNAADYRIGWSNGYLTLTDLNVSDGDDGSDALLDIETLRFADRDFALQDSVEFRINTTTTGNQDIPTLAALDGGGMVVCWFGNGASDSDGIYLQRYDANGVVSGAETRVNSATANAQSRPAVSALEGGGFVVVWQSELQDGSGLGIYAQAFRANGDTDGAEFRVNATAAGSQSMPAVAALAGGGFVISWQGSGAGDDAGVFARRYDQNANVLGSEFLVNSIAAGSQFDPAVTALAGGGFVVGWSGSGLGDSDGVFARRYDANGAALGETFRVNTTVLNSQSGAAVAALNAGGFVVVWNGEGSGDAQGIFVQRYDANGFAAGSEFRANTSVAAAQFAPTVTALANGGFLIGWHGSGSADASGIYAQRYDAVGVASGAEFQINRFEPGTQDFAALAALGDGGFMAAWVSAAQDGDGFGVFAQRFDGNGNAVLQQLTGTAGSDRFDLTGNGDVAAAGLAGDDVYIVNNTTDSVIENAAEGTDQVRSSVAWRLADGFEELVLTGNAAISGVGNAAANLIVGNSAANLLNGSNGADTLNGGFGDDIYVVDNINDVVIESSNSAIGGVDLVRSFLSWTLGNYTENLALFGNAPINATGNSLDNVLTGNDAANLLDGGSGADTLRGAAGDDTYRVDNTADVVIERLGAGIDSVEAAISWTLGANLETLRLASGGGNLSGTGNALQNYVAGNEAANALRGLLANDTLAGGAGNDTLFGGGGTDVAVFSGNAGDYSLGLLNGFLSVTDRNLDDGDDGTDSLNGVEVLRFADTDVAVTGEFRVNSTIQDSQYNPAMAALDGGGFVAAWQGLDANQSGKVYFQRFAAIGDPRGSETVANSGVNEQYNPAVATLASGDFVIVWHGDGSADQDGIFVQIFDAGGAERGAAVLVNTATANGQYNAVVAALAGGGFVVSWESVAQDGSATGVYAQRYDAAGVVQGAEFRVNTSTLNDQFAPRITALANGGFVVVWSGSGSGDGQGIFGQRYDALGVATGAEFRINSTTLNGQYDPAVAALASGGFVVTWDSYVDASSSYDVRAQRYDANGVASGAEFRVNTTVVDAQYAPAVAALPDGGFVVTWQGSGGGDDNGIHAQRYSAAGVAQGVEFLVNSTLADVQDGATITGVSSGGFVIGWGSYTQDGSGYGVYAQRYDADGVAQAGAIPRFEGGSGNDVFDLSGPGEVYAAGGPGDDRYIVDSSSDYVEEFAQGGDDTVQASITYVLPTHVENLELTGSAALDGTGNVFGNAISGNSGSNVINGLEGNDTLVGGGGADTLSGGSDDDDYYVEGGETLIEDAEQGTDHVFASGDFTLADNIEDVTLQGSANISATGNDQDNTLMGNSGDNTLDGGAGADIMQGGAGDDTYYRDADDNDQVVELPGDGYDTVFTETGFGLPEEFERMVLVGNATGGSGNDRDNRLEGNGFNNSLSAAGGADELLGFDGDDDLNGGDGPDTINGGTGVDTMDGGSDDDIYYVDDPDDTVIEQAEGVQAGGDNPGPEDLGTGIDTVISQINYTLAENVEILEQAAAAGDLSGVGNILPNILNGNEGNNSLRGLGANDTLNGGLGNDTLDGGNGADSMSGGAGNDNYVVNGNGDQIRENEGEGTDSVRSSANETLAANVENLTLAGGANINGTGNGLANTITGNGGNNTLSGAGGADLLRGAAGNDSLVGGTGSDRLFGGGGADTLVGGAGSVDFFVFDVALSAASNVDLVADFEVGVDKMRLDDRIFSALDAAVSATLADAQFHAAAGAVAAHDADDRIIYNTTDGALYYDADGIGGAAAVQFAVLGTSTHPALGAADFQIFG